ncbi:glycoside hydrolase family 2 protein [Phenylobacterium deserti]|uniref:Beta-glucuronidase n=1 Tax=Phenylobacterium deserti TaxID=1914756 RepID=A0A328AFW0_9CAUL|nr:glycoside hydrolase family 2 TIM barrel-domain containing protein [Phenylobacterium deserti]RAK52996.1 beta-glucuronidase [Phenylobacterium deserti]
MFRAARRFGLALAAAAACASVSVAQPVAQPAPTPVLVAADLRDGVDLNGAWNYSIDPFRDGLAGFHGEEAGKGHRRYDETDVAAAEKADPQALYEYDMRRSPVAYLPSSWITQDPTLRHYEGLIWYQRTFTAHLKPGQRAFLRFGAVDYTAHVYVNGKAVGRHEGGFTPFAFEVTGLLRDGENQVTVGADSQRNADSVPPPVTDWENYGGITRAVKLVVTPATFVDDAWVRLTRDGHIAASVKLDGPGAANAPVRVRVAGANLTISGQTDASGAWTGSIPRPRGLRLWSPESPTLYDVTVEAGGDVLRDRIGFRTIEVRGEDILLNGKSVFLRGISLHEEEIGKEPTRAITPASARALLSEAKVGLNGNFVRLAHYPHSEVMTRAADEMGLLVWSEIPVYWRVAFSNPQTLANARKMLAENIVRDRNRASIILWSVANETPISEPRTAFLSTLVDDVRALDDSRLVTAALLADRTERDGHPEQVINDPLAPKLDVMAINTYNGWYSGDALSAVPAITWRSDYRKPLIFSELGADAQVGFHDENGRKFSEEFQAEYFRATLAMADKVSFLRGMSPWILKDFRSPRRQHPVHQQGWNRKGLISETGQRKQAFQVLADHYRKLAEKAGR